MIDNDHKLDADLVDDSNSTNKFVTAAEKSAWDAKQDALVAGTNIQIAADGKTISATDTTYTAGTGISIDANNNNAIAVNAVNSTAGIAAASSASDSAFPTEKAVAAALAALLPAASTCASSNNHCVLSVNKTNGALQWVDVTSPFEVE